MTNCIIIHGCPSVAEKAMNSKTRTYDKHWIPWTKRKLDAAGVRTHAPLMPEPWNPVYEKFKRKFEKYSVTENTTLIGHSCGCAFLVRWLGESGRKIKKLILVAPWKIADEKGISKERLAVRKAFYGFHTDKTIRKRAGEIVMFTSDNEEPDGKRSLKIYCNALGGKVIELKGRGHYTLGDMKTEEFPELIETVLH